MTDLLYAPMAKADMAGQLFVSTIEVPQKIRALTNAPSNTFLNLPFQEAVDYFVERYGADRETALGVLRKYREQAIATADRTLEQIAKNIVARIESTLTTQDGTIRDFVAEFESETLNRSYLETVYKTNIQSAYGAGRVEQIDAVGESFGYVQFMTAGDAAVRDGTKNPLQNHAAMDGKIWKYSDPQWKKYAPPVGYNCRCAVVLRDAEDVDESSEEFTRVLTVKPDPGWEK